MLKSCGYKSALRVNMVIIFLSLRSMQKFIINNFKQILMNTTGKFMPI